MVTSKDIEGYVPKTVTVTVLTYDLKNLARIINDGHDSSGIIHHIVSELGIDFEPEV